MKPNYVCIQVSLLSILTFCAGCGISRSDQSHGTVMRHPNLEDSIIHGLEIETKSWKLPEGVSVRYLSKRNLQFANRKSLTVALYGVAGVARCVDFYVRIGNDDYVLITHDA